MSSGSQRDPPHPGPYWWIFPTLSTLCLSLVPSLAELQVRRPNGSGPQIWGPPPPLPRIIDPISPQVFPPPPDLPSSIVDVDAGGLGDQEDCVICHEGIREGAFIPCGHRCVCMHCAEIIRESTNPTCPICRARVETTIRIFM